MQYVYLIVSTLALIVIAITMLARANDFRFNGQKGIHWKLRMTGFVMVGVAPFGLIAHGFIARDFPSIHEVVLRVGLMFVFVTTPHLPPWWKWITRGDTP